MYYGIDRWAYFRERKAPFATTLFGELIFLRLGLYLRDYGTFTTKSLRDLGS